LSQNAVVVESQVSDTVIVLGCPVMPKFSFVRIVKRESVDTVIVDARRLI
jgi:hypothetical protein